MLRIASRPQIDWNAVDPQNPAHQRAVIGKLNEFMLEPITALRKQRAMIQELTTKDATPDMFDAVNVQSVIQSDVGPVFDFAWQEAFDMVDMRSSNKGSFDIMDVSSGLAFAKVKEGMEAEIYQISGSKTNVPMDLYGGGLSFSKVWWDDQEYYKIEQAARDFRWKYFKQQATLFYGLIVAVTDSVAFDTDDQTTINNAVSEIIRQNDGTVPIDENAEFLLYCAPELKGRLAEALAAVVAYTAHKQLQFRAKIIGSVRISSTSNYWCVYPGAKSQWGNRMDLAVLGETDIYRYAENAVGWGRYGGAVNAAQVRQLALS
jgi:hypothetical protein|tara:strand:- start:3843 stop:4796 length:954 start_codon:yes stop_codon:yes gene_type:complete